tara:strand:- start:70385 stop:70636 length:252 start_codon:yes stop_codon:yes gene_type:complete
MKYRVKHIGGIGYFSQVKINCFNGWKTVAKHMHGFGEYPNNHIDHPLDSNEKALLLAKAHLEYWKNKNGKITYKDEFDTKFLK